MKKLLINFSADYADEFNVYGLMLCSEEVWNEHLLDIEKNFPKPRNGDRWVSVYFGTNEDIQYRDFEDYKRAFSVKEVSEVEFEVLKSLISFRKSLNIDGEVFGNVCLLGNDD